MRLLLLGGLLVAACVHAQTPYPAKPIRLIVPFPPGGSTTIVARLYSQKLIDTWGQQVVVDNRGGGNTIIGSEAMVKAAPDGYTLLHVTSTHVINPSLLKTPYDATRDFAPVAMLVTGLYFVAGLLVLAFLGIVLYGLTVIIEQRFTGWAFRGQNR